MQDLKAIPTSANDLSAHRIRIAHLVKRFMDSLESEIHDMGVWVSALELFSETDINRGLEYFVLHTESRRNPRPVDVIKSIRDARMQQWIGPDEAWGIALTAFDEEKTVVWPNQVCQKAFHLAQNVIRETNDYIAARLTFRDAYVRMMQESVTRLEEPVSVKSQGWRDASIEHKMNDAHMLSFGTFAESLVRGSKHSSTIEHIERLKDALRIASSANEQKIEVMRSQHFSQARKREEMRLSAVQSLGMAG